MKKVFGLIFTLSVLVFCSNITFADPFVAGTITTVDVVANFDDMGEATLSIELKNAFSEEDATGIDWIVQDITPKQQSNQWKWSTTYAIIKSTVTDPKVNYYLYQKNKNSDVYKSTAPRTNKDGSTVYSGLVNKELQGGEYRGYIPLSFLFSSKKLSTSELQKAYDPNIMTGDGSKVARYFTDVSDSNFDIQYAVIACADTGGIAFYPYGESGGYAPWTPDSVQKSKKAYMYFGGNFINININDIFGTDQIFIEEVVE